MKMRRAVAFAALLSFVALSPTAEGARRTPDVDGTAGSELQEEAPARISARALVEHHRNARRHVARAATSVDIGNVAVLVDNGSLVIPPRPANVIDLSSRSFTFEPLNRGFRVEAASLSLDPDTGSPIPLGDDSTVQLALPFAFPFLGTNHTSLFLNSDGNVTFGEGDVEIELRDAIRLVSGPPRIAPLLMDLDVTAGGSISAGIRQDRAVFTWANVPEFGTSDLNTVQLTLHATGQVDFVYGTVQSTTPFGDAVAGVTGGNNATPLDHVDFASLRGRTYQSVTIFEEFGVERPFKIVDVVQVAKEFYRTHPDHFDFLVMFTNFEVTLYGTVIAFHDGIQNRTRGLGIPDYDDSALYGSTGELEGFIHMNDVRRYWPDEGNLLDPPIDMFRFPGGASNFLPPGDERLTRRARRLGTLPGGGAWAIGLDSPVSILAHETFHRWAVDVPIIHPGSGVGADSLDLVSGLRHWSFFFNTRVPDSQFGGDPRASTMGGNAYRDFGANVFGDCPAGQTRFRTEENELVDGYTELDQYVMGVRLAAEVGPFWYLDNPTQPITGISFENIRPALAVDDIGVCGNRVDLTIANIQSFPGVGPRIPAIGDEDDDGHGNDVKTQAFILVVESESGGNYAEAARHVDTFRRVFQGYINGPATSGRGKFDTSLNPVVH